MSQHAAAERPGASDQRVLEVAQQDLHEAAKALRAAIDQHRADRDEAFERYATDADTAIARMEADLAVSGAALRAERAASRTELDEALREAAATWHRQADELRLQTHLGQMEARDAGVRALDELDAVGHRLAALAHEAREDTDRGLESLRHGARRTFDDLRSALEGLWLAFRPERRDDPPG